MNTTIEEMQIEKADKIEKTTSNFEKNTGKGGKPDKFNQLKHLTKQHQEEERYELEETR